MREDIIRDRALQKETLFNPRLVAFHPRSNENNETDPSLSHKNFNWNFLIEILFDKKKK